MKLATTQIINNVQTPITYDTGRICLVMGDTGTGKSTSLRTLNPEETYLIKVFPKPLPFKTTGYKEGVNVLTTDNSQTVKTKLEELRTAPGKIKTIIIDDYQYIMGNENMRRCMEKGFDKWNEMASNAWSIIMKLATIPNVNSFVLTHTMVDEVDGIVRPKTLGKLIKQTISFEGMFTIVLQSVIVDGAFKFLTKNDGKTTAKSPMGMFDGDLVDNDLRVVSEKINEYYK